jgi:hypothetical protein
VQHFHGPGIRRAHVTVHVIVALTIGSAACRTRNSPPEPGSMAAPAKVLSFEEATTLRDQLNDAMISTMLQYMNDCDLMADKLEEYLAAHRTEYETVAATLEKIPWPAQELPPDQLQRRLAIAHETIRRMTPASQACRANAKSIAVMRSHFYGNTWQKWGRAAAP